MGHWSEAQAQPPAHPAGANGYDGRYVYCIARAGEAISLGSIGIEGREVYTVAHRDLGALVHDCVAQPYRAGDSEVAAAWVLAHHQVVEAAWKRWGAVLPLTFNTIIKGEQGNAQWALARWLAAEYHTLSGRLDSLAGKAEYSVQVFCDSRLFARNVTGSSLEVSALLEDLHSRPRGLAYMYRQKLENELRRATETKATERCKAIFERLARHLDNVRVEKVKQSEGGLSMLMNLSCLVSAERYLDLKAELERIAGAEDLSIRLAGPLPPYSFC